MIAAAERHFALLCPRHRVLLLWIAAGASLQACLPSLQGLWTLAGPVALWLWALPLAAFGLDLLLFSQSPVTTAPVAIRRRRGTVNRSQVSRRDRPRAPQRFPARSIRRAG